MTEQFRPLSEKGVGWLFGKELDKAIADNPDLSPAEAAALQVKVGVLGPLFRFGDSLGLSEKQVFHVLDYATRAVEAAKKEKEAELNLNPLLQLDARFAREANITEGNEKLSDREKEGQLFRLELARKALRSTQENIKTRVAEETNRRQKEGEDTTLSAVVEDLYKTQKEEGISGFYTKLAQGRPRDYEMVMELTGSGEAIQTISELMPIVKIEGKKKIHNIPTDISGVEGEIPHLSTSYGEPYLHFGIVFSLDAVLKIAQSSDLPPLK